MNPYRVRKASCPKCGSHQFMRVAPTPCKYAPACGGMIPALERTTEPATIVPDRISNEILRAALATDESVLGD